MSSSRGPKGSQELREEAERALARRAPTPPGEASDEDHLLHELRVRQIELELQNVELEHATSEAESAREHFAMLFDFAPIPYFRLDDRGTIVELNLAAATLLGPPRAELVGDTFTRFVADEDRAAFGDFLSGRFVDDAGHQAAETELQRGDGARVAVELAASRITGEPQLLVAVSDRTDRTEAVALRRERASEVAAMARLHAIATRRGTEDPTGLFNDIVDTALAITGARSCILYLPAESGGAFTIAAHHGASPEYRRHFGTVPIDRATLTGVARQRRTRVTIEDLSEPPAFLAAADLLAMSAAGIRAAQSTPLVARTGAVLGVLSTYFDTPVRAQDQGLPAIDVLARLGADVLEQRRLMSELRDAEARHRQFLDGVADPVIIVDPAGNIAYANNQAHEAFGYLPGELVGQAHSLLVREAGLSANADGPRRQFAGRRKDGSEFPIEVTQNPFMTDSGQMISTVVRDITERRRLEAAAAQHTERLASAIEAIPDVIGIWDRDDRLVTCNSAFCSVVAATSPAELIDLTSDAIILRATPLLGLADARAWFSPPVGDAGSTVDLVLANGRRFRVTSRRKPAGGWVTTGLDLTEDLLREQELGVARMRAEAASRAKDEFLASMSHELRTPLNAVLGFCQLLQRDRKDHLTDRQREMVDQVAKGGEHLLALIDDVLDLVRIEANRVPIASQAVNIVDTVTEVMDALGPLAERAGVSLDFDLAGDGMPSVEADPRRLVQILMNLTSNAIKYNNRGGTVTFEVSTPRPQIVRVTVVDTGRGIPAEQQPKLFTAFQRAGQEGGAVEGTGIGLVISRRLAELMNGSVGFVSRHGYGSSFWVDLPVHIEDLPRPRPVRHEPRVEHAALHGVVVYVDDNAASLALIRAMTDELGGVELLTASNAADGLVLVRQRRPDLVLMDINLPGMGGVEALAVLRSSPETRDIPVVAVSAAATALDRERGLHVGFLHYLTKPVRFAELEDVFHETLHRSG